MTVETQLDLVLAARVARLLARYVVSPGSHWLTVEKRLVMLMLVTDHDTLILIMRINEGDFH